jgi:hypothetical protein
VLKIVKPVSHSIIWPSPAKKTDKEIMFLHSFATEEICSASLVVENVQPLVELSLPMQNNNGLHFSIAKFFQKLPNTAMKLT